MTQAVSGMLTETIHSADLSATPVEATVETNVTAPQALSDIPGLGPIRVRALHKAGYETVQSLREATLEQLTEVRGLTEAKARQIIEYLDRFPIEALIVPESIVDQTHSFEAEAAIEPLCYTEPEEPNPANVLVQRATRAMGEVIGLLVGPDATQLRSRVLRGLGTLSEHAESLAVDASFLSREAQDKAIRRLRRATKAVSDFVGSASDRKAQARLADVLDELNGKLSECRLKPRGKFETRTAGSKES